MTGIEAKGYVTVNRPLGEVFAYWHDLENLPRFMAHLPSPAACAAPANGA